MKFNPQLRQQLELQIPKPKQIQKQDHKLSHKPIPFGSSPTILTSGILRKPINKTAAMVVSKAPWWAHPPQILAPIQQTPKPKQKNMSDISKQTNGQYTQAVSKTIFGGRGEPSFDLQPSKFDERGQPLYDMDNVRQVIISTIESMPRETRPSVHAAEDARRIVSELVDGLAGDMSKFHLNSKKYLEDIRAVRFAVVTETASMTKELKDIRQFFLGNDYAEQIKRLREFVELCERLSELKRSGFLDSIADTMLKLA